MKRPAPSIIDGSSTQPHLVGLLRNARAAWVERDALVTQLGERVREGRFDVDRLFDMAARFGTANEAAAARAATSDIAT